MLTVANMSWLWRGLWASGPSLSTSKGPHSLSSPLFC